MSSYARATEDQFVETRFHSAREKSLIVNATVRFLKSGLDPAKFTKRAYHFFHQTLSMPAEYNQSGFAYRHFSDDDAKNRFLQEVRRDVQRYANLDPERNSDMAKLFLEDGPYGSLLQPL